MHCENLLEGDVDPEDLPQVPTSSGFDAFMLGTGAEAILRQDIKYCYDIAAAYACASCFRTTGQVRYWVCRFAFETYVNAC